MGSIASQITSLTIVYSVYSEANQRKHQSSASLAFCGEFTGDRWIPRTNGQLRGKCFHLMTSSCIATSLSNFTGTWRVLLPTLSQSMICSFATLWDIAMTLLMVWWIETLIVRPCVSRRVKCQIDPVQSISLKLILPLIRPMDKDTDSKIHGANMGPTWALSAPCWPHEPCYQGR